MGCSPDQLTPAPFDLLEWLAKGCPDGVYEGTLNRPGFLAAPMLATSPVGESMVERSRPPRTRRG